MRVSVILKRAFLPHPFILVLLACGLVAVTLIAFAIRGMNLIRPYPSSTRVHAIPWVVIDDPQSDFLVQTGRRYQTSDNREQVQNWYSISLPNHKKDFIDLDTRFIKVSAGTKLDIISGYSLSFLNFVYHFFIDIWPLAPTAYP